jgi:hypothetical protein
MTYQELDFRIPQLLVVTKKIMAMRLVGKLELAVRCREALTCHDYNRTTKSEEMREEEAFRRSVLTSKPEPCCRTIIEVAHTTTSCIDNGQVICVPSTIKGRTVGIYKVLLV